MVRTLLFGDDSSAFADVAWMWIGAQHWEGWAIDVLTANCETIGASPTPGVWQPPRPRRLQGQGASTPVRHLRSSADPRQALLEYPEKDLVVIGPRGRGLFKAMHLGSTADGLMRSPTGPLVVVRRGLPVRSAMVCTDGSRDASAAARALAALPWLPDVDVTVVAVQQSGVDTEAAAAGTAAVLSCARSVSQRLLRPDPMQVFYSVHDIILSAVAESEPDLLVHGTTGVSGWAGLRAGTIAAALAARAACSVLMARAPQA